MIVGRWRWATHALAGSSASKVLLRGAAGSLALNVINAALTVAVSIALARILGVTGYGIFAFVTSAYLLLLVPAVLGVDRLLTRDVAVFVSRSSFDLMRGLLRQGLYVTGLASVGVALLMALAAWWLNGRQLNEIVVAVGVGAATIPFAALGRTTQAGLMGIGRVVLAQTPELLIRPVALLALVLGVASFGSLTATGSLALQLASVVLSLLLSVLLLRRSIPLGYHAATPTYLRREWIVSTFELAFMSGAAVVNAQTGTFLLGALRGPEDAGLYAVAARGALLISFGLTAVNTALAPTAARLWAAHDINGLQRVVTSGSRAIVLFALPVAVLMVAFGATILDVAFGPGFRPASGALAVLSLGQLANGALGSVGTLLIMTGHQRLAAAGIATGAILNLCLALLLIPWMGAIGAALAATVSVVAWNILLAVAAYRRLGIHSTALGTFGRSHVAGREEPGTK